jgi:alkylation response protein AidB-like acyl-CoA dehydrogenase
MSAPAIDMKQAAAEHAVQLNSFASLSEKWQSPSGLFFAGITLPVPGMSTCLSATDCAHLLFELGKKSTDGGFNFSIAAHLLAGVIPMGKHGTNAVHFDALKHVAHGAVCANAMTESSSGSDAFRMKTTATRNGNAFVLNGSKTFVTNGPVADYFVVYALTDPQKGFFGGVSCFLLDKLKHKFTAGPPIEKNSLRLSPMCELFFDDCTIAEEYLIGKEGGGAMIFMESMDWERACIAAMHAGTISRLCEEAAAFVKSRIRGGQALAGFQGVQFRIADIAVLAETSRLMALRAAAQVDRSNGTLAAAQAKIIASESLLQAATLTATVMGGSGITNEKIANVLGDAQAGLIYSGPNDVLRDLIASQIT